MIFNWNEDKNMELKKARGISFEEIIICINNGQILDILEHPNKEEYENQKIYIVNVNNYAFVVPFIDNNDERFLKTIFPSRKYTRLYIGKEN